MEFYGYKKCSTCRQAYKVLQDNDIEVEFQDFVQVPPTREQLLDFASKTPGGLLDLVNPRGTRFRELGLKDQTLTDEQWLDLLTREGKLLKRPIVVLDNGTLSIGYNKDTYAQTVSQSK